MDFLDFIHHDNGILEVIFHQDVELNESMTLEFLNHIESIQPKVSKLLVNRKNKYSYTFKATMMLAKTNIVQDVAVVKYGRLPWPLKGIATPKLYHLAFFDDYNEGFNWLTLK